MNWTSRVRKRVLPNGLTLLVQRDASAPVVAVVTHVKAGYFDEPDEWVGIAHVLEHMYFKGTDRRGPGQIARETQIAGGYVNAATIYDKTLYYTVLPSVADGFARALDIQADALMNAALDAAELRRELQVIVEEARRKLDAPEAVAGETLFEVLFSVHRMRRWRIGTEEQLRRLTPADLLAYYRSRYTPDRVIVGIAGDVEAERALALAEQHFGSWDRPPTVVPGSPTEPNGAHPGVRVLRGDVERPLAVLGWKTVEALHPDAPALDIAAAVLGLGRGSRLYRALRTPGMVSGVSAYHYTPTEVGVFGVSMESEADRVGRAVEVAAHLVEHLGAVGPSTQELRRVKALLATQWSKRFESSDGRAATLCEAEALGDYRFVDEHYRKTMAVEAGDVLRVTREYLRPAMVGGVFYLPHDATTVWATGQWPPQRASSSSTLLETTPDETLERTDRPGIGGPMLVSASVHAGEIVRREYAGADVLVRSKRGSGLVSVGLHFAGAREREKPETAGISWLLARTALRGAGSMSAAELAETAEQLGGAIVPTVSFDALGWSMTTQADALADAASLLRRVAEEPRLEPEQVSVERELLASDARSLRDDMFRFPIQAARGLAFPDDAYGLPSLGEAETVGTLSEDLLRIWAAELRRQRPVIVAVGDLDVEMMLEAVSPLAEWPQTDTAGWRGGDAPKWGAGRGRASRSKAQTALAMAFPACPHGSPDRFVVSVLCSLLSGLAGRLFDELRERRSLAYTVAALPWLVRRAGAVFTYVATSPEREDEARDATLAVLGRVAVDSIDGEELERARQYAAGTVEVRRQSGRAVADEILTSWIHGTTDEFVDAPNRLRAVTEEDIRRVAASVFRADRRAEYVVRGRGRVEE